MNTIDIPTLDPESSNNTIAQASRCALRTYANNIKHINPDRATEIQNYVRDLDKDEESRFMEIRKKNAQRRNNEYGSAIMNVLRANVANGNDEMSVEDLRLFFQRSRKYKSMTPYISHILTILQDYKLIRIEEGYISIV